MFNFYLAFPIYFYDLNFQVLASEITVIQVKHLCHPCPTHDNLWTRLRTWTIRNLGILSTRTTLGWELCAQLYKSRKKVQISLCAVLVRVLSGFVKLLLRKHQNLGTEVQPSRIDKLCVLRRQAIKVYTIFWVDKLAVLLAIIRLIDPMHIGKINLHRGTEREVLKLEVEKILSLCIVRSPRKRIQLNKTPSDQHVKNECTAIQTRAVINAVWKVVIVALRLRHFQVVNHIRRGMVAIIKNIAHLNLDIRQFTVNLLHADNVKRIVLNITVIELGKLFSRQDDFGTLTNHIGIYLCADEKEARLKRASETHHNTWFHQDNGSSSPKMFTDSTTLVLTPQGACAEARETKRTNQSCAFGLSPSVAGL